MAINYSYPKDLVIESADLFLGIRASDNRTVNYTAKAVSNYLNTNAEISISSQLSFRFTTISNIAKTISFPGGLGDGTLFSAITELVVSIIDASSSNVTIYLDYLIDSDILLSQQNEPNNFGHYKITGYTQNGITPFYTLTLEFIGGNGNIVDDTYYDIAPLNLNQGGGGGSAIWGDITGDITDQTDLIEYLSTEYYPLNSNPAGYLVSADLLGYATESWTASNFYPLASNPAGYLTAIPTIQQVLNAGDTATNKKLEFVSTTSTAILSLNKYSDSAVRVEDVTNDTNSAMGSGGFVVYNNTGSNITSYELNRITNNSNVFLYPAKPAGSYTFATTDDIPTSTGIPHGTAVGTDTYTVTISGVTAYADGDAYIIRFTNGNTSGCTLNISGVGARTLYRNNDGTLIGGDIVAGGDMLCVYDSAITGFRVIGTAPNTLLSYVTNDDSVTLTKGMPVYAFGGTGDRMTVKRAKNTGDSTSAQTVGLVLSASIGVNQKGLIMMQGLLDELSILPTSTWNDGDAVYLGATDGSITNIKPSAPNHLVYLGVVTTASNGSAGRMYVRVQNGYELQELHNVAIGAPLNNQGLVYETSTSLWKNKTIIEDTIADGVTDKAPSQNAVFDALALKQDKSLAAYTVIANNTSATANGDSQTFKSIANQVYTGTPIWTGTTAPSGATTHSYSWNQIGNLVTVRINLSYVNGGGTLTAVTIPLPTDCPAPYVASGGAPSNNRVIAVGSGIMQTNFAPSSVTTYVLLKTNSTNTGFDIFVQRAAANYQVVTVMVIYLTT